MAAPRTLAFLALFGVSSSQSSECSYSGLLNHLNLTNPEKILLIRRPVKNWTSTTLVQLDMLLFGILDVDEKSQTVTSHNWIEMQWTNEFLTWNSSDFCGIDTLSFPRSMIWIPDINIQEDASDSGSVQMDPVVIIQPSGLMSTTARQRLTFTCQFRLSLFPFDKQHCNITFSSMSSDMRSIILGTVRNSTTLTRISEHVMITQGEWKLNSMEIVEEKVQHEHLLSSKLIYMVTLERKPMLYVINLIVPLFYLLVLDLASFFISEAGGEKLGFKVTVLLSISVLLLILKDILPSTEDDLPMIAQYCVSVFTMVWLSVLEAMLTSFLLDLDESHGKKAQGSADTQEDIQLGAKSQKEPPGVEEKGQVEAGKRDRDLLKLILEEVRASRQLAGSQGKDQRRPGFYSKLAKTIDTLFFICYFLTVQIFLFYMCISWIRN
ncbi:5-hydroxytryptamine receptor 3A-like isoform X2 [Leuresthes tenuis]|uniref:5-hydroxytryptamine receptor 3A-like isoform X2 n=1 Tax=Leuresthes tenuis TaxID=355514 RepID=UPI003B50311B